MLATLLPGVREIRTPLVVGYTWLITLWLAVGYRAPQPGAAHGFLADVYRLSRAAGPVAVGAAVSVGAYLLGVIATSIGLSLTYKAGDLLRKTPFAAATPGERQNRQVRSAVDYAVAARLAERLGEDDAFRTDALSHLDLDDVDRMALVPELAENRGLRYALVDLTVDREEMNSEMHRQIWEIAARLRSAGDPTALEFDRLQAEADFRLAMFGPLAALCVVAGVRWSPAALLLLPLLTALLYTGVSARAEAQTEIAYALASGRLSDPTFDRLTAAPVKFAVSDVAAPEGEAEVEAESETEASAGGASAGEAEPGAAP